MSYSSPSQSSTLNRSKPILPYCGLTFILSKPSRHDYKELISGSAGNYFDLCLRPFSRYNCDIRILGDNSPFLEGTKVVVLLGSKAQATVCPQFSLNDSRGYCFTVPHCSLIYIPTYEPQDTQDQVMYSIDSDDGDDDDGENDIEQGKEKEHSPTRRKNWKFWFFKDLQKAISILKGGYHPRLQNCKFDIYADINLAIQVLSTTKDKNLYLDIENDPDDYTITVISFSFDSSYVWCVPFTRYDDTLAYDRILLCKFLRALSIAFAHNTVVVHNALHDLFILGWKYRVVPPPKVVCTMISQHRIYPESEKSLGHCISLRTHEVPHKQEGIFYPQNPEQERKLWFYNAKDVFTLALVHQDQVRELNSLPDSRVKDSVARANAMIGPYLLSTMMGMAIDTEWKESQFELLQRLKVQYHRIANILAGYTFDSLGSPQQVAEYLYEFKKLPLPPAQTNPKTGIVEYPEKTASGTLYKLQLKNDIPFIKLLLAYRHIGKRAGFLKFEGWTQPYDNHRRVHNPTRFTSADVISGTDTFRIASRKLYRWWGSNGQNLEKRLRRVVVADPGKILVQTDQSGAEALIVAYLCRKGRYRLLFENNIKPHVFVALHLFRDEWEKRLGISLEPFISCQIPDLKGKEGFKKLESLIKDSDNWATHERFYYLAKQTCHSANYDIKAPTFQLNILKKSEGQIVISRKDAEFFLGTYHDLFPEIRIYHKEVQGQLNIDRTLYNLFGSRRIFYGHWDDKLHKQAYAFVPQSSVGELTSIALTEIQSEIDKNNIEYTQHSIDILKNGHDAIISQCLIGHEKFVAKIQEKHLAKTFTTPNGSTFKMKSESNCGFNWYQMGEIK